MVRTDLTQQRVCVASQATSADVSTHFPGRESGRNKKRYCACLTNVHTALALKWAAQTLEEFVLGHTKFGNRPRTDRRTHTNIMTRRCLYLMIN